jgi:hypothetical protein
VWQVVKEEIWVLHMRDLWNELQGAELRSMVGYGFEAYTRRVLLRPNVFQARQLSFAKERHLSVNLPQNLSLPACTAIRQVLDLADSVRNGDDLVLYYSVSEQEPLIDYIFKSNGVFYCWNATVGPHKFEARELRALLTKLNLKQNESVHFGYTVPIDIFATFQTDPVYREKISKCTAWVIGIPKPQ